MRHRVWRYILFSDILKWSRSVHFNNINLGVKKCEYQHRDQQQATYTYNGTFIYYVINNFREAFT